MRGIIIGCVITAFVAGTIATLVMGALCAAKRRDDSLWG